MKNYPLTASKFRAWATHRNVSPRIKGIVEHYAHHQALLKYQRFTSVFTATNCAVAWLEHENMPLDLVSAKLLMSECDIGCIWKDLELRGRIDQAYQDSEERVILVDSKSHSQVTFSDQLQLSFYAHILRKKGYRLAEYAYIRAYNQQDIEYLDVDIIPARAFIDILKLID